MKQKHIPKSKEELIADLKKSQKWQEKMKFTKEKFYPAVLAIDSSVDETKTFLASINSVLMEKFLGKMRELKMSDLKLQDALDSKDVKYQWYIALLDLFNDMSVFDAKDCIEGMKSELATFENDLMKEMNIKDLKTKWLDEI